MICAVLSIRSGADPASPTCDAKPRARGETPSVIRATSPMPCRRSRQSHQHLAHAGPPSTSCGSRTIARLWRAGRPPRTLLSRRSTGRCPRNLGGDARDLTPAPSGRILPFSPVTPRSARRLSDSAARHPVVAEGHALRFSAMALPLTVMGRHGRYRPPQRLQHCCPPPALACRWRHICRPASVAI